MPPPAVEKRRRRRRRRKRRRRRYHKEHMKRSSDDMERHKKNEDRGKKRWSERVIRANSLLSSPKKKCYNGRRQTQERRSVTLRKSRLLTPIYGSFACRAPVSSVFICVRVGCRFRRRSEGTLRVPTGIYSRVY